MSRLLTRAVRLLKFGAVAGVAVGVGRLIVRRRRMSEAGESSWPTIAETAAQNGHPVDDQPDEATPPEAAAGDGSSDAGEASGASDEAHDRA